MPRKRNPAVEQYLKHSGIGYITAPKTKRKEDVTTIAHIKEDMVPGDSPYNEMPRNITTKEEVLAAPALTNYPAYKESEDTSKYIRQSHDASTVRRRAVINLINRKRDLDRFYESKGGYGEFMDKRRKANGIK